MKVWILNHYALAAGSAGGTRHFSLAKELLRLGHSPLIIASNLNYATGKERPGTEQRKFTREVVEGVPFLWVKSPPYEGNSFGRLWNMLHFSMASSAAVRRLSERPDIVVASSPHLFAGRTGLKIARRARVPFVLEIRDLWPASLVDLAGYSENSQIVRGLARIERRLYENADRIIALTPKAGEYISDHGGGDKTVWLPNGVDLSALPPDPMPFPDGPFSVVYAGAHGVANGLDTLLDAAKLSPAVTYRLVGDGPEKPRLMGRAETEGIINVRFEDPVPKERVYECIAQSSACITHLKPADVFKWGVSMNKLWDYMAVGRPIIFAVNSSNDPVAEAGAGISVPPGNPQAMADAVLSLGDMPSEALAKLGQNGRRYVEEHHDSARLGKKLEQILLSGVSGWTPAKRPSK